MSTRKRIFAGGQLRSLRTKSGLDQAIMAQKLGVSISYLSQLENDKRPLTSNILAALGRNFPYDIDNLDADDDDIRFEAMRKVFDDPIFGEMPNDASAIANFVETQPIIADYFIKLHEAYRNSEDRLQIVNEIIDTGASSNGRLPWDEIRDWFHEAGNYIDLIDRRAEILAQKIGNLDSQSLQNYLQNEHSIKVALSPENLHDGMIRYFDKPNAVLHLGAALSPETLRFQLAYQTASLELNNEIATIASNAALKSAESRRLLTLGLINYAAAALLMPYEDFKSSARTMRHDIDRLCRKFKVSFEQACHRLSTLQRPGARGVPFFFCRVDMAGNITKRHSATSLEFARFGGACPLWIIYEAVAIPDRILVQLAQTPDNAKYVIMAKGLVKPSGRFDAQPRRYAVALGCETAHAHNFIYADNIDVNKGQAVKIGTSCRVCPRTDCQQRAFPPVDRSLRINTDQRNIVPYTIV